MSTDNSGNFEIALLPISVENDVGDSFSTRAKWKTGMVLGRAIRRNGRLDDLDNLLGERPWMEMVVWCFCYC